MSKRSNVRGIHEDIDGSPVLTLHEYEELERGFGFTLDNAYAIIAITKEEYEGLRARSCSTYVMMLKDLVDRVIKITSDRAKAHDIAWDIAPIETIKHLALIKAIRLTLTDRKVDELENIVDMVAYLGKIYERITRGENTETVLDSAKPTS